MVEEYFQSSAEPDVKRFHNLRYVEKVADISGSRTLDKGPSGGTTSEDMATEYNVADLFALVKKYDQEFNPQIVFADKKRIIPLLHVAGFKGTGSLLRSDSIGSISYQDGIVNISGANFSDVIDWQDGLPGQTSQRTELDELRSENNRLKKQLERAKGQTKLTRKWLPRPVDARSLARTLREETSSTVGCKYQ